MLVVALGAVGGTARAEEPAAGAARAVRIEVDGRVATPWILSVNGDPDNPAPGDVAWIGGIPLLLGEGPEYRFRTTDSDEDGRIYLLLPGGGERVVGARSKRIRGDRKQGASGRNLLDPVTDAEMAGLWGLHLDDWDDAVAAKTANVDPSRICITMTAVGGARARGGQERMPDLPAGLRALILSEQGSDEVTDLAPLARQQSLVLFHYAGLSRKAPIDVALLRGSAASLRHLGLDDSLLRSSEHLASFAALRELRLGGREGVRDLSFARGMTELRRIGLRGSAVSSLEPLAGLDRLECVEADRSAVARLPDGPLPALRTLRVMSSAVDAASAATFAQAHPRCRLWHGWTDALHREFDAADRVRIRSGGNCHRRPDEEKTLADVGGAVKAREFLALLVVKEDQQEDYCGCCGNPSFEFFAGDRLLGTVGFHHGQSLRWPGGWPGDAYLTPDSAARLVDWLAANGAPGPKNEVDKRRAEKEKDAKEEAEFLAPFPEPAREWFRAQSLGDKPWERDPAKSAAFAAGMAERCGGPRALAAALCRSLGASSSGWTRSGWREIKAQAALGAVTDGAFAAAVAELGDDRAALRGAARIAFQEGMFDRLSAEARGVHGARLAAAALDGGEPWYAWRVARALGDADSKEVRELLWKWVEGANPPGEEDPPTLAAAALISLAKLGDAKAGERARSRLPSAADPVEKMALEVALAMLGEGKLLRPPHFSGRSSVVVLGAMDAVARSPRREGLEALVAAMQIGEVRYGFELAEGFFRATGWSFPLDAINYPAAHRKCLAWWKQNGEAYLKKVRAGD